MNNSYNLEIKTIELNHTSNDIQTYELHFNSYEESIHLTFFKENGLQEEFLNIVNDIINKQTFFYFTFVLKRKISRLKKHFYSQEKKYYSNNNFKSFSTSKHYLKDNIENFLLFDKHMFKDDLKRLHRKFVYKNDSIQNVFDNNISDFFSLSLSKFGYYKNKKKNIIYFDKWGSISFQDNQRKLILF